MLHSAFFPRPESPISSAGGVVAKHVLKWHCGRRTNENSKSSVLGIVAGVHFDPGLYGKWV